MYVKWGRRLALNLFAIVWVSVVSSQLFGYPQFICHDLSEKVCKQLNSSRATVDSSNLMQHFFNYHKQVVIYNLVDNLSRIWVKVTLTFRKLCY